MSKEEFLKIQVTNPSSHPPCFSFLIDLVLDICDKITSLVTFQFLSFLLNMKPCVYSVSDCGIACACRNVFLK